MTKHTDMGPSGAARWMTCTASVPAIRDLRDRDALPEREDAGEMAEGTAAHEVRETALKTGSSPFSQVGRVITIGKHTITVDEHMADHLVAGIDWLREQADDFDVELRVKLDPWMPNQIGTLDAGAHLITNVLLINDFKYGVGNPVYAENNKQVMLYALGYWHYLGRPNVDQVLISIDQPRRGGMKFWACTLDDLRDFGAEVSKVYLKIHTGDVEFKPSPEACQWCPVKDSLQGCAAYDEMFLELFKASLDPVADLLGEDKLRNPDHIDPELRVKIIDLAVDMKNWIDTIRTKTRETIMSGGQYPGIKLIKERNGKRSYSDEQRAASVLVNALGVDAFQPAKLIGITEAEKRLKPGVKKEGHPAAWAAISELLEHDDPVLAVVPEGDPRPPFIDYADEFDDLE